MRYLPNRFSLNHIIERPWIFSGLCIDLYDRLIGDYYREKYGSELSKYGLEIDPFNIYWIDPDIVSKRTGRHQYNPRKDIGTVKGGSWDRNINEWRYKNHSDHIINLFVADSLDESAHYRSLESHFIDGVPWEETELYNIVISGIDHGLQLFHGSYSEVELRKQLEYVDQLYDAIKEDGYKTQMEIIREGGSISIADFPDIFASEITVDVGRDGELLFVEGRHRLTIGKLLGLDEIPVVFLTRHNDWVAKLRNGSIPSNHPDQAVNVS